MGKKTETHEMKSSQCSVRTNNLSGALQTYLLRLTGLF